MKRVILTKGLPGSGKSTWAKERLREAPGRYKRISKDDLRTMLDNGKWSKHNEQFILAARDALILAALQSGYSVIVDDTGLHQKHEAHIRELIKDQALIEIEDFTDVPLEVCIERDQHRPNYVGEQVIRRMYREFLEPKPPVIEYDPLLPYAIMCDLDGTLALMNGRNSYDAAHCEQDLLNPPILDILRIYAQRAVVILLVSGRKREHEEQTRAWLGAHDVPYHNLWMRETDDNRKDSIVKQELYEQHIRGKYNVRFCLDDRNQVVQMWRSLGLTVLQVAEGDF